MKTPLRQVRMLVMKATPSLNAREEKPAILVFFSDERRRG
jgi:hypothetical protein